MSEDSNPTPRVKRLRRSFIAVFHSEARHWVFLACITLFIFVQVYLLGETQFANTFVLAIAVVVMGGAFYGWQMGMLAGMVMSATVMMFYFGDGRRSLIDLLREGWAAGYPMLIACGFTVGRVRELWDERREELQRRRATEDSLRESQARYRDLLSTVERQARTLALMEQVQNALARELDRASIFRVVVEATAHIFTYKLISIYEVDADSLRLAHQVGYNAMFARVPLGRGVMSRCVRTRQPILLTDVAQDAEYIAALPEITSEVCVPLFEGDRLVAVFNVESGNEYRLDEDDLRLLEHVSEYVNVALERARMFADIQENARQMALLNEITNTAVRANSPAEILFQSLADRLAALIESDGAYITLWDEVRQVPLPAAAHGQMRDAFPRITFPPGQPTATATVLHTGRALVIDDYPNSPFVGQSVRAMFPIRSALVLPLIANQQKLGAVLFTFSNPHAFTNAEVALAEQAAGQVALALTRLLLIQRIEQMAVTDELTGLYNRHGLADLGRREFERALRYGRPLSAMLFDVDHFKQVNDACGHAAGDEVLRQMARACRETLRETDLIVRYGGEEFLVLMPENKLESALETAERLRAVVESLTVDVCGARVEITASFGVSEIGDQHASLEALIACADRALYAAKQAGRNQVSACS